MMATLTAHEFETADGAEQMANVLGELQSQRLITILDAAIVSWPRGAKKLRTNQLTNLAAVGALGGSLRDVGINDELVNTLRAEVTEGTSALFLMSTDAVPDRLAEELKARNVSFKFLASNLSHEQEARLREVFGAE